MWAAAAARRAGHRAAGRCHGGQRARQQYQQQQQQQRRRPFTSGGAHRARRVVDGEVVDETPAEHVRRLDSRTKLRYTMLGTAAFVGVGTLAFAGSQQASVRDEAALDEVDEQHRRYPTMMRERMFSVYGNFAASIGVSAASAVAAFRSQSLMRFAARSPLLAMGGAALASIGSLIGLHMVDEQESPMASRALWATFAAANGATLAPLGLIAGPAVTHAAVATGGLVGGLATVASTAPSDSFLWMAGPLTIGLGVVFASSLGALFFPASGALYNMSLYGGLSVFGGFMLYDVQSIQQRARVMPKNQFQPIKESTRLYLNTINIFVRMVQIMQGGGGRRKK